MNVYECKYHVTLESSEFDVVDWIVTGADSVHPDSVGHYWRHLHNAKITNASVSIASADTDITKAIISNHRYITDNKTSESGQMIILYLLAIVAIIFCIYIAYIGLSQLAGCSGSGGIFQSMLSGLAEVLR